MGWSSPVLGAPQLWDPELLWDEITCENHPAPCLNFFWADFVLIARREGLAVTFLVTDRGQIFRDCQHQSPITTEV